MQKDNPGGFFSFLSKVLFMSILGESVVYMVVAIVILPIMIIGIVGSSIRFRVKERDVWALETEWSREMKELGALEKAHRSRCGGDPIAAWDEIKRKRQRVNELSDQIAQIKAQRPIKNR